MTRKIFYFLFLFLLLDPYLLVSKQDFNEFNKELSSSVFLSDDFINILKCLSDSLQDFSMSSISSFKAIDEFLKSEDKDISVDILLEAIHDMEVLVKDKDYLLDPIFVKHVLGVCEKYKHQLKEALLTRRKKFYSSLIISNNLSIGNQLKVSGNTYFGGNLYANKSVQFCGPLTINFPSQCAGGANALTVIGSTDLIGLVKIEGDLIVSGSIIADNIVGITGATGATGPTGETELKGKHFYTT